METNSNTHKEDEYSLNDKSEYVQEILGRTPSFIMKFGIYFFFIFIVLIITLSNFIRYPDVVIAQAILVSDSPPIKIYSPSTGKLGELSVLNASIVKEGDLLAVIDNSARLSDIKQLKEIVSNLNREVTLREPVSTRTSVLQVGTIRNTFSLLDQTIKQFNFYVSTSNTYNNIQNLKSQIDYLESLNEIYKEQLSSFTEERNLKEIGRDRFLSLYRDSIISKSEYEGAEIQFIRFTRELDAVRMNISNNEVKIKQIEGTIINLEQTDQSYITSSNIKINDLARTILDEIASWERRFLVKAPTKGRITYHRKFSEKEYVTESSELFTIVPAVTTAPYAVVYMPEQNSGKAQSGNEVLIKLNGYNYREFGILKGRIVNMSLTPNEGFYTIDVELTQGFVTTFNKELPYNQNMAGVAEIILDDLSLFDRIFYNIRSVLNN